MRLKHDDLVPHLFRQEFGKITSVLCKHFTFDHIEAAEDIASETFLSALEVWTYNGIPDKPEAWLYAVAKNKALNHFKRQQVFNAKLRPEIRSERETAYVFDLSDQSISDSQLQMLFVLCHPSIASESQIALSLKILCGFSLEEIATALLSNKETISKRIQRAKEKLREAKISIELPPDSEIQTRLDAVLTTLYLLFNEGYYSESDNTVVREDLCKEAIRLTEILIRSHVTSVPKVYALLALMCFHASRLPARKNIHGELVLYADQDESLWDTALISKGVMYMKNSSHGNVLSKYHLEAAIAYWHTQKEDTTEKWENILSLYNHLLKLAYSPVAALNRTYALFKVRGQEKALAEAEKLRLENNQYYHVLLAELYATTDQVQAIRSLNAALQLTKTSAERQLIERKLNLIKGLPT